MSQFQGGDVLVANRVINLMVASAASRVEGVAEVKGFEKDGEKLRYGAGRYIETAVEEDALRTSLMIRVKEECSIIKTVEAVQREVRREVESMLGLRCLSVDVAVI